MIMMKIIRMEMALMLMLTHRSKVKRSNTLIFLLLIMIMMIIMRMITMMIVRLKMVIIVRMKMVRRISPPRSKVKRSPPLSCSSSNTGASFQESQHHLGWASEFLVEIMILTRSLSPKNQGL